MQTERQVAANLQTKPTDLACESVGRLLSSTSTIAIYYYYYPENSYSFYRYIAVTVTQPQWTHPLVERNKPR